jgi:hypothetical protein
MWYCKLLDLPTIPEHFVQDILTNDPGEVFRDYQGWAHFKDGKEITSASNPFYYASKELEQWLKDNIESTYNDVGIRYAHYKEGTTTAGVHTDQTRKYVLQYLLKTGNGILNFWQEKGHDVVRDGRYTSNNYNDLILLESFNIGEGVWVLLNTNILHSVENLDSDRISVQVSLNSLSEGVKRLINKG